jgi:hypothetical protein
MPHKTRARKIELIKAAHDFRADDPVQGAIYMGCVAKARLYHIFHEGYPPTRSLDAMLDNATGDQLSAGLKVCAFIIDYMQERGLPPVYVCPTCGQNTCPPSEDQ